MTDVQPADPNPSEPAAPAAADPAGTAQPATADPAAQQRVEDLPDWAQKIIRDGRGEAAKYRTEAKTAAEQAQRELADKIAVAAGLKQDQATDPAALAQQLTASQQAARDAAIQLAVYKTAGKHQGNPDALLDSNTFLAGVSALDPTSSDFPTQVADAIKAAVTSNPTLRIAQAAGASAADHAGGSGEAGQITEQQLGQMTPEQIDKAYREGRLKHLL